MSEVAATARSTALLRGYIVVLAAAAAAVAYALRDAGPQVSGRPNGAAFVGLIVLLAAAEYLIIRFRYRGEISSINQMEAVLAPLLFAWRPLEVVFAVIVSQIIAGVVRRNRPVKVAFNVAQWALAAGAGAAVVFAAGRTPGPTVAAVTAIASGLAAVGLVNHAAFTGVLVIVGRRNFRTIVAELGPNLAVGWFVGWGVNSLMGVLFVLAYAATPAAVALFAVPLVVQHLAYRNYAGARADRVRLAGLHRAARTLTTPFDPTDAFEPYLREVASAFEARAVELLLSTPDGGREVYRLDTGRVPPFHIEREPAGARTLEAELAGIEAPVRATPNGHRLSPLLREAGWRDCLAAPLVTEQGSLGTLVVLDQGGLEGFEEGELAVIEAFARETAASIAKGALVATIEDERRKLALIVDATSDGMCTFAADGTVRTWNAACERITGLPAKAVVGRRLPQSLAVQGLGGQAVDFRHAMANQLPPELRISASDGREVRLSCSYSFARDGDDAVLVVVARDVTAVEEVARLREQFGVLAAAEEAHRSVVEQLQQALTPAPVEMPGVDIAVAFQPSDPTSPTGGDLYDWRLLPDGSLHLSVVDVLGHGVAGTKDALSVIGTLRILAMQGRSVDELVADADALLAAQQGDLVATVVVARYDPRTGDLEVAGGGHPPPLLRSADGQVIQLAAPGVPVGWPGAGSEQVARAVLAPGDTLILYTDGVIEARKNILEGLDLLVAAAAGAGHHEAGALAQALLDSSLAGAARQDDSLVLVFRLVPDATATWRIPVDRRQVSVVRSACASWFEANRVPSPVVDDLRLIASELLTNAVQAARTSVTCRAALSGERALIEVIDDGDGEFEIDGAAPPLDDRETGRGLFIVQALADRLDVDRLGMRTRVRATKTSAAGRPRTESGESAATSL